MNARTERHIFQWTTLVATAAAVALAAAAAGAQSSSGVSVTVDGAPVAFSGQGPVERGGRVLVPLRGVLEKLGAYVSYDAAARQVTAVRSGTEIVLPIGGRTATVGGQQVSLDAPAEVVNGATLVPLRFVAESLGARVAFEPASRTVAIIGAGGGTSNAGSSARPPVRPIRPGADAAATGTLGRIDLANRTLVLRGGDGAGRQTYELVNNFLVQRRVAGGTFRPADAADLRPGDPVRLELNNGRVRTITVLRGGAGAGDNNNGGTVGDGRRTVSGTIREVTNTGGGTYTVIFESGARVDVDRDAPVLYRGRDIGRDALRTGDRVTVRTDPADDRGRRIEITTQGRRP
jgi:hypothetical protein